MTSALATALLTGAFGLGGIIGGALLTSHFAQRTDQRRIMSEDERRLLTDRRQVYARFFAMATSMLISIKDMAVSKDVSKSFFEQWENELRPVLGEIQLLADPKMAELAECAAWALMLLNEFRERHPRSKLVEDHRTKMLYPGFST
jgi:hypothetical protein